MNERIRELAEQQGLTGPNYLISSQELEKFAELIVRECVEEIQLSTNELSDEYHIGFNTGLVSASKIIEQHFGVQP